MLKHRQSIKPGESKIPGIRIYEHEARLIANEVASWPNLETGGFVWGYWDHRGNAIGHLFLGPGANAVHAYAHFEEDTEFVRQTHSEANSRHGVEIVMRVHSHHRLGLTRPSSGDARSQASFMARNGFRRMFEMIATFSVVNTATGLSCSVDDAYLLVATDGRLINRQYAGLGRERGILAPTAIRMDCYLHEPLNGGYRPCAASLLPGVSPLRAAFVGITEDRFEPSGGVRRVDQRSGLQRGLIEAGNGESRAKLIAALRQECASLPPAVRETCDFIPSDDLIVLRIPARDKTLLVAYRSETQFHAEAVYVQAEGAETFPHDITAETLGNKETFSLAELLRTVEDRAWAHETKAAGLPERNIEDANHGCPESPDEDKHPSATAKTLDTRMEG